ncbi:MAG: hypothetical protein Q7S40_06835 [Opitutaceae bacterium]|nr:hypothetical protein [Opitutaceae bacterium]
MAEPLHRCVAAGAAALVLVLTIFAASPTAHGWLHVDDRHHDDGPQPGAPTPGHGDDCAVVLFASGVSLPVGPVTITPPTPVPQSVSPVAAAEICLVSPRFLHQPERGPPVERVG